jgi:hypothetical protein
LARQRSGIWKRKLNHEDRNALEERIPHNFIFAIFAAFVVQLFILRDLPVKVRGNGEVFSRRTAGGGGLR